jgi:uncharacterized protein (DUF433 family)
MRLKAANTEYLSAECITMLDWSQCAVVERSAEKVSGAWLFVGTRVPVEALFENLEDGATIDEFVEWFPGVQREQVIAVLQLAEQSLVAADHDNPANRRRPTSTE